MSVDPIDDCTFWFTSEYMTANGQWRTRIARFGYDSPICMDAPASVCGNNIKEVGEDCDGADAASCPGVCQPGCTCPVPSCGNNVIEVGEECDGTSAGPCSGPLPGKLPLRSYAYANAHTDGDTHSDTDCNADSHAHADPHSDSHCDAPQREFRCLC
jgi:hypothetical protein